MCTAVLSSHLSQIFEEEASSLFRNASIYPSNCDAFTCFHLTHNTAGSSEIFFLYISRHVSCSLYAIHWDYTFTTCLFLQYISVKWHFFLFFKNSLYLISRGCRMPKSKEVLSSTSGSDSDSDVDTKVCVILIHLLLIYYQDCQFISQPMKIPDVYINQVCYLNVFIVSNGEELLWQQDLVSFASPN